MATGIKDNDDGGHVFPEDIAMEILQRLPVEPLLRFKCISSTLALWNPATRMVTNLPPIHFQLQPFFQDYGRLFGFGLDPFTSNYKVIWVRHFWDNNSDHVFHRAYAAVYSFSNDSWKILKNKHHNLSLTFGNIYDVLERTGYHNGAYYWMLKAENYCSLLAFDFHNEVFREIRGPHVPPNNRQSLILRDGSINLLDWGSNADFALWVMIQLGVWNKHLTFHCLSLIQPTMPIFCGFWDSTTVIFLSDSSEMISYDVKTHEIRHLGYQHQGDICGCMVYFYKESLVTIKRGNRELDRPF